MPPAAFWVYTILLTNRCYHFFYFSFIVICLLPFRIPHHGQPARSTDRQTMTDPLSVRQSPCLCRIDLPTINHIFKMKTISTVCLCRQLWTFGQKIFPCHNSFAFYLSCSSSAHIFERGFTIGSVFGEIEDDKM